MAADHQEYEFSLKVMINKDNTKVLFAEVDSDFADILLSFLTLPLGSVVRILKKHYGDEAPFFGSLNTLYNSVENLDNSNYWTETGKQMLLNPRSSFEDECRNLKININDDVGVTKYYTCETWYCASYSNISMYSGTARCSCRKTMSRELVLSGSSSTVRRDDGTVFTLETSSFVISDDLRMVPIVAGSIIQTLGNLGITDTAGAKQTTVTVGSNEIIDLLKKSLLSRTPLTDLILHKFTHESATKAVKIEPACTNLLDQAPSSSSDQKKMKLKVMMQRSTDRFLFAHAEDDFVDFLFSFLTIPLGGIEYLLEGNTSLKNIDNLYRSIATLYDGSADQNSNKLMYLKTPTSENSILKPLLPPMFHSKKTMFSLDEQDTPEIYYWSNRSKKGDECLSSDKRYKKSNRVHFKDPKGKGSYVKGPQVYMVSNDLTVSPLSLPTTLSVLNSMNIPLCDVKEVELQIGLKEALNILKASLSSSDALTSALNPMLMKQPKKEPQV